MADAVTTPPAPPAAVTTPPPADTPAVTTPPEGQSRPNPFDPENDPDHQIRDMIARRRKKAPTEGAPNADGTQPPPAATPSGTLGASIAGALKFRMKEKEKPPEAAAAATAPPAAAAAPATTPAAKAGKPKPKAPTTPVIDPTQIVEAATTAATNAAMNAVQGGRKMRADTEEDVVAKLSEDERDEYAVAKFMSENNPQHKGAEAKYLDVVRKTSDYSKRWEAANPGKPFDPDDEEHDEFFAANRRPWRDSEFRRAEAAMVAKESQKEESAKTRQEISKIEQQNAKLDLEKQVDGTVSTAWANIIHTVDEGALKHLSGGGTWEDLANKDLVTARALSSVARDIQPLVEAIIQIDDPHGRIKIDMNNPTHQQWANLLLATEKKYAGHTNEAGQTLVSRAAYGQMSPTQRAGHFYLTHENLLQELQDTMAETVKTRIKSEREMIAKAAESMGYTKPAAGATASPATTTTPSAPPAANGNPQGITAKPVSPTSGSSTKNDIKDPNPTGGITGVLQAASKALFGRG